MSAPDPLDVEKLCREALARVAEFEAIEAAYYDDSYKREEYWMPVRKMELLRDAADCEPALAREVLRLRAWVLFWLRNCGTKMDDKGGFLSSVEIPADALAAILNGDPAPPPCAHDDEILDCNPPRCAVCGETLP